MEGMGPEHSSCRPERFLQMCSDDPEYFPPEEEEFEIKQLSHINMIVANCSKPGNYFHLLRRQICLPFRKPLIVMTPKSLLRHPECRSSFNDINQSSEFHRMLLDEGPASEKPEDIKKVLICTGKVYYDLTKARRELGLEHKIQGAWSYIQPRFQTAMGGYNRMVNYIGRETAPSPATGSKAQHNKELKAFVSAAMAPSP